MGKVLGALPTLDLLPLVYLLTCVTVVKSSAQANEYSRISPGIFNVSSSNFEVPFCSWSLLLPSPPLLPHRPVVASWLLGVFCL